MILFCVLLPRLLTVDAGVKIAALHKAEIKRFVLRLATNFTARRNFLPEHHLGRKPKYGELVRPLPRKHKDKTLAATAPEETCSWFENGREIRAEIWRNLVVNTAIPDSENETFDTRLLCFRTLVLYPISVAFDKLANMTIIPLNNRQHVLSRVCSLQNSLPWLAYQPEMSANKPLGAVYRLIACHNCWFYGLYTVVIGSNALIWLCRAVGFIPSWFRLAQ
jgi:hypothetical protein